ncbi:pyrroloquinoline quinone biosynthesis protein PqqB [Pseudohongiella sp. SYSU M77423]|uniref:pyrroloquinoline quinone biosynthesis protein PqqB n=1 Tax=Pseudohongiella sp. SYSU M77423 TaxID=3042312 RepID=UPI0024800D9C|nr:pyrroloquinoline quinone biosynthesis protein PqqB [Pseudohongiella sp. SYSU M77423]MDH7943827.1 pyrroloquinoline quinone biosynthesis protein PqqB [Pseudohongiella sp. SYSU M77423]MEC8861281.1 pyrroloquinoline quinone biosynthesis protein PqqB [Pseudomonadota bacterium]
MRVHVLGSAAGGGFPQWNCNCPNCDGLRKGTIKATARTQSSIAVSSDNINWLLFNTSPDILAQFQQFPELQPGRAIRDTAIRGIVLMDAQIDHTTGLFMLREGKTPLDIYCTDMVHEDLTRGNPIFNVLGHFCGVTWHQIPTAAGSSFEVEGIDDIRITAVPLSSKAPPFSPHRHDPHEGDNIGIQLEDTRSGKKLFYAPGLASIEPHLLPFMQQADCLMVDGTCWTNDEMQALGISNKLSLDMGHMPQSGPDGMIEALKQFSASKKILIHINNTNPILREDSRERAMLQQERIDVAFDGMDFSL